MIALLPGAKITILVGFHPVDVEHATVLRIGDDGRIFVTLKTGPLTPSPPWVTPLLDGIAWVRGHHRVESDAVKALIVANALLPNT